MNRNKHIPVGYNHKKTASSCNKNYYSGPQHQRTNQEIAVDKCKTSLLDKILQLKERNVLNYSLSLNSTDFEVLEFYGDSVLYERISFFVMQTRRFMNPHLLTTLRSYVVQNKNLAVVFDSLGLEVLLPAKETKCLLMKSKADVVEAIVGELAEATTRDDTINTVLMDLLAYIHYVGEKAYFVSEEAHYENYSQQYGHKHRLEERKPATEGFVASPSKTSKIAFSDGTISFKEPIDDTQVPIFYQPEATSSSQKVSRVLFPPQTTDLEIAVASTAAKSHEALPIRPIPARVSFKPNGLAKSVKQSVSSKSIAPAAVPPPLGNTNTGKSKKNRKKDVPNPTSKMTRIVPEFISTPGSASKTPVIKVLPKPPTNSKTPTPKTRAGLSCVSETRFGDRALRTYQIPT